MKVWTQPGWIGCGTCGRAVDFDEVRDVPAAIFDGYVLGACTSLRCPQQGVRFRFPMTVVDCEVHDEDQQPCRASRPHSLIASLQNAPKQEHKDGSA